LNDEFYFILSDFDAKKRNQTSLQNKEIDDLIRTLSPSIVIKVIDACQSGTLYVKEVGLVNKYFQESKKEFKKCYFMNSSLTSQSSFANDKISFFTASFVNAIKEHKTSDIRYKDIIDVIADDFSMNQEQTPFFIIQADLTEKFCTIEQQLKDYVTETLNFELDSAEGKTIMSLSDLVKLDALNYIDKDGAVKALKSIQNKINTFTLNEPLKDLYEVKINFLDNHRNITKLHVIVKWLKDNEHDYFATPITEERYDDIIGMYPVVIGFDLDIDVPFKVVSIDVMAKYPNILSYHSEITYFISKKSIRFFYFTTNYLDRNWNEKELETKSLKWFTGDYKIASESDIMKGVKQVLLSIQNKIESDLENKFKVEDKDDDDDDLPF